ncbi:MAG: hypothetical protein QW090_04840 [Candidatus Bathyarchaeia archaeon]
MKQKTATKKALIVSRIGIFAALYAVTSLVPISIFIGAPSFLALNLIITPVMAILFPPLEALFTSLSGGVIAFYISPSQAMFGPYTILLPVVGATLGSLTYHKAKSGVLVASIFLATAIIAYLIKNYSFPYFVVPHSIAIVLAILCTSKRTPPLHLKIPLYAYISTMTEQGMMMIFAVHLLGLPWQVFVGILPLMVYERIIGTLGATILIVSLLKILSRYFILW